MIANYNELIKYIEDTWWNSCKKKFLAAWTNRVIHFGNVTTNRVESAHASFKKSGSSRGDLVNNLILINNLLISHHVAIRASFHESLSSNLLVHQISAFNNLRGFVSSHALQLIT